MKPGAINPAMQSKKTVIVRQLTLGVLCLFGLQSCEGLPSAGPRPGSFDHARWQYVSAPAEDGEKELPFVMVEVDRKVIEALKTAPDAAFFKGAFTDRTPPADTVLGVGDTVRITIFEAGPGGLFVQSNGNSNGNYVTLPDQEVDQAGRISVPYAGTGTDAGFIKAQGRKLAEVQHDILQRLSNKAIEPQVIVTIVKRTSNMFSVIGEVNSPGRFNLDQGGVHVLDALSIAGGPKNNDYNTLITLERGTTSATARLTTLLKETDNNIFIQPGDLVAVKKDERYYNILGATHTNNRVPFEAENVTVADAIAKAGGLNGDMAEPAMVVVMRREEVPVLETMGVKLDDNQSTEALATVYRFNFNEPSGMFLAQSMQLRNNDVVYVSEHPFSDFSKLLGTLRDVFLIKLIQGN